MRFGGAGAAPIYGDVPGDTRPPAMFLEPDNVLYHG
jgi:hypothetical protein